MIFFRKPLRNGYHEEILDLFPVAPGADQIDSSEDSTAYRTEDDIDPPNNGPSQRQIVMATEGITKKIQELLQAAQGGENSK